MSWIKSRAHKLKKAFGLGSKINNTRAHCLSPDFISIETKGPHAPSAPSFWIFFGKIKSCFSQHAKAIKFEFENFQKGMKFNLNFVELYNE